MAHNVTTSVTAANTAIAALGALLNGGTIKIYDGSQPATPDTAITTQNLLATGTFSATAFGAASNKVITANTITTSTVATTGTAAWFRAYKSDGTTPVIDGTVGTSGADFNLNTTSLVAGANFSITSGTLTQP